MPPPPPPPPPGMAPGLPPPPNLSKNTTAPPNRQGLLSDIAKGKQLKKTATNDRSAPLVASSGGVVSSNAATLGKPPTIPGTQAAKVSQASSGEDNSSAPPQLGGLFAGGMPTLRKTNPQTSTLNQGGAPSQTSAVVPQTPVPPSFASASREPPSAPKFRPQPPKASPLPSPGLPPLPPPPIPPPGASSIVKTSTHITSPSIAPNPGNAPPPRPSMAPPSLPSAPPPPLPSSTAHASTSSTLPLLPPPPPPPPTSFVAAARDVGRPIEKPVDSMPSPLRTMPLPGARETTVQDESHSPSLDGLQAALISRNTNHDGLQQIKTSSSTPTQSNGFVSTNYSLKPSHVKRVDDSRYRFQPDTALPPIRPHTNCAKAYRSGRPGGTTVPLDLSTLQT